MNVSQIKAFVLFETNNDQQDAGEFEPFLLDYINEGYDRLTWAYARKHVQEGGEYPPLQLEEDEPSLPAWVHLGIANWAAWCVYRNGNPGKQSRGFQYRAAAEEMIAGIYTAPDVTTFHNIPR